MSITVLLLYEQIYKRQHMFEFQSSFSCPTHWCVFLRYAWRVFYNDSMLHCLTSRSLCALWIFTGKDFAVIVCNENTHSQWIRSRIFWPRDSDLLIGNGEKKTMVITISMHLVCKLHLISSVLTLPSCEEGKASKRKKNTCLQRNLDQQPSIPTTGALDHPATLGDNELCLKVFKIMAHE